MPNKHKNKREIERGQEKPFQVLYKWQAPERIWEPKSRTWYLSYAALIALLILVCAIWGYYVIILGLIAFLILWFIQGTIPPWIVQHQLTNKGLFTNQTLHHFDTMTQFWFATKDGQKLLHIDFEFITQREPRLTLLVGEGEDEKIFDIMGDDVKYANVEEADYNIVSKWIYGEYIPITNYIPDLDQPSNSNE